MSKSINFKLKALLDSRGLTQKELALRADVRPNTIGDLIKNKPKAIRFETLVKIAEALDVEDIKDIIDFEEGNNNDS